MAMPDRPIQLNLGLVQESLSEPPKTFEQRRSERRQTFEALVTDFFGAHRTITDINNLPNSVRIMNALDEAEEAHKEELRLSKEDYVTHPIGAASHLISIFKKVGFRGNKAADIIIAILDHDIIENTDHIAPRFLIEEKGYEEFKKLNLQRLTPRVGKHAARMILAVSRPVLERLHGETDAEAKQRAKEEAAKAIKNPDEAIVKAADRWHNLTTLTHLSSKKQNEIILETLAVYLPVFKIVQAKYPEIYSELKRDINLAIIENCIRLRDRGLLESDVKNLLDELNIRLFIPHAHRIIRDTQIEIE
jgi:(p)ppGpp synthase/HD superfamily hydrolase